MLYFAYGSNMDIKRLEKRVGSVLLIDTVELKRHTFAFHKKGIDSSAKADAFYTGDINDVVYGVLFKINRKQKLLLDKAEGLGSHYQIRKISVYSLKTGQRYKASMYYAVLFDSLLLPTKEYKGYIVNGAKQAGLPDSYVTAIDAYPVKKAYSWTPVTKPFGRTKTVAKPSVSDMDKPTVAVIGEDGRLDPYASVRVKDEGEHLTRGELNRLYGGAYTD